MNYFLFSIDLEDFRTELKKHNIKDSFLYKTTYKYLKLLEKYKWKTTFFTVGKVALSYKDLISDIQNEGHEIGCHSFAHDPTTLQSKEKFKNDLLRNIEALNNAGVDHVYGYRAPQLSITENAFWVYEMLEEHNFLYSSSVLPASNPLYGWNGFGESIKKIGNIFEIPISISKILFFKKIPYAGGIYFRLLPKDLIKNAFVSAFKQNKPVVGYFHPQDIKYFKNIEYMNFNKLLNILIKMKTDHNLDKIEYFFRLNNKIISYKDYINIYSSGISYSQ